MTQNPTERTNFAYYNAVDQIYHAEWSTPKLARLELLRASIQKLWPQGHPTRMIHVAGSAGKGSTCRFLEMGLSQFGNTGAYLGPHLFDYRERFSINGEFVSKTDLVEAWETRIKPHCVALALETPDNVHSFLETSILMALALFEKYQVRWAAMETGIGGRYDQTRALDVEATLLTNVGSDHAQMLGSEQWQRTLDKAGIARPDVPFFTSDTDPQNIEIMDSICEATGAPLYPIGSDLFHTLARRCNDEFDEPLSEQALLNADYQQCNAALAFAAITHLEPYANERAILQAFRSAQLLGRFWQMEEHVYVDVAHNAEKVEALTQEIEQKFVDNQCILVIGLTRDRLAAKVFPALLKIAKAIIVTGASFKGRDPEQLRAEIDELGSDIPTLVIAEPKQALQVARAMRLSDDVIILTGSTYMIEQVLNPDPYLSHLNSTFGWRAKSKTEATGTVKLSLPASPSVVR